MYPNKDFITHQIYWWTKQINTLIEWPIIHMFLHRLLKIHIIITMILMLIFYISFTSSIILYKNLGTGNFKIITEQERGIMIDSCIWTLSQVVQVKKVRKKKFSTVFSCSSSEWTTLGNKTTGVCSAWSPTGNLVPMHGKSLESESFWRNLSRFHLFPR